MVLKFQTTMVALTLFTVIWGMNSRAHAWWETGHMVTAQVAYQELTPAVRQEADRLMRYLDNSEPDPARRHFVPASVWMDDVKARGFRGFDTWHYANIPFNPEGLLQVPDVPPENIIWAIEHTSKTLNNPKASDFEKALALRLLIHLVGDIHQPFHAIGRMSHEHPHGDQGGNLFTLPVTQKNIHFLWDSTAGRFPSVSTSAWAQVIPGFAKEAVQAWPKARYAGQLGFAPGSWAQESYRLAVKHGYEPLQPNQPVPEAYIQQAQTICEERIALGGYRLAELLNQRLGLQP